MEMMDDIKANVKDWGDEKAVREYLYKIATKKAFDMTGLIYGMGHAVYTISDPRAVIMRDKAKFLAEEKGMLDEYNLYLLIEKLAPDILYEIHSDEKRICTNVDFFSGFIYEMLNIPRELFTPIFAVSRIAGWSAHRIEEMIACGRIYRPAYQSVCEVRKFIPMEDRK